MLRDRLKVSERRACRFIGHRLTQRRPPVVAADDQALRTALREFAGRRPRWGYRRAHHHLREEGWRSTASACSASGATRACACRSPGGASARSATGPTAAT